MKNIKQQPRISVIAAVARNRAIGKENQLLWYIPEDLKRFKQITQGQPVIMGQKTFESLAKPLPGRFNIVLTRDRQLKIKGCSMAHSIDEALKLARAQNPPEFFFIGGGSVYQQALPLAQRLYLTLVEAEPPADTFFPDYSAFDKVIKKEKSQDKNYHYTFLILER